MAELNSKWSHVTGGRHRVRSRLAKRISPSRQSLRYLQHEAGTNPAMPHSAPTAIDEGGSYAHRERSHPGCSAKIIAMVLVSMLSGITALAIWAAPRAEAHGGYIGCSSAYEPDTWSKSFDTNGTHYHTHVGSFWDWLPWGFTLRVHWPNAGPRFWSANAPGTHTGYATCHLVGI